MIGHHTLKPQTGAHRFSRASGRGDASGRGSYSGRGAKGQKSRSGGRVKQGFEGGQTPLLRRLPKLKGFNNPNRIPFQVVNVADLNVFDEGMTVDLISLYEQKLVSRKNLPVKILGGGEVQKKLTVKVDACSASAKQKIEAKNGTIVLSGGSQKTVASKAPSEAK